MRYFLKANFWLFGFSIFWFFDFLIFFANAWSSAQRKANQGTAAHSIVPWGPMPYFLKNNPALAFWFPDCCLLTPGLVWIENRIMGLMHILLFIGGLLPYFLKANFRLFDFWFFDFLPNAWSSAQRKANEGTSAHSIVLWGLRPYFLKTNPALTFWFRDFFFANAWTSVHREAYYGT